MAQTHGDTLYALGRSDDERLRLIEQDRNFGPSTTQLFVDAGIGPGMRVLDVGCGVGDVSFRAAVLVGTTGTVVGIDADTSALDTARQRAQAGQFPNVSFRQGDLRTVTSDEPFDAVVGRLVLVYLQDPVDVVRHLSTLVRPGGILAFQELVMGTMPPHVPDLALVQRSFGWIFETFHRAGMDLNLGLKLYRIFAA